MNVDGIFQIKYVPLVQSWPICKDPIFSLIFEACAICEVLCIFIIYFYWYS